MNKVIEIVRTPLRTRIADAIWELILTGKYAPGARLREVELAELLGVSRTPLREALVQMEQEGMIDSKPARGFTVCPLTRKDVEEIYPLRAVLESYALKLAGEPAPRTIAKLQEINEELESEKNSIRQRIELDEKWHSCLVSHCPSGLLLKHLESLKQLSRRYEYAYMRENTQVEFSTDQHREILAALENGSLDKASALLADNMTVGMDSVGEWVSTLG